MSVLMVMRQRMKAVETIQKITHAMRLISMSSHTKLRNKKYMLSQYTHALQQLFAHIYTHAPTWHNPILMPQKNNEESNNAIEKNTKPLIILIGSHKGLCGNFNTSLFSFFEKEWPLHKRSMCTIITVGKRAHDYIKQTGGQTIHHFDEFTSGALATIAQKITNEIMGTMPHYPTVTIYSNYSKSFFVQQSRKEDLLPLSLPEAKTEKAQEEHEGFTWEQTPNTLLTHVAESLFYARIQNILLESLTAEQAARFVAMDSSTRNARNLLDDMRLDYNKKRQAKITRELTDLIGSL